MPFLHRTLEEGYFFIWLRVCCVQTCTPILFPPSLVSANNGLLRLETEDPPTLKCWHIFPILIVAGTDYCAQGHSCVSPKVCVNTPTSSECLCPTGYLEANGNCTDINECVVSETQPDPHCYEGTLCLNTPGGYQCGCKPGYETVTDTQCRRKLIASLIAM